MLTTTAHGHVAVFAFPFGTHADPLLALVQWLSTAAPNLKFSFFNSSKSNKKIFSDQKLQGCKNKYIKPYDVDDGVPPGHVFSGNPLEPIGFFLRATPDNFKKRLDDAVLDAGRQISCVISDAFLWFSSEMAKEMGVPWVAFWTAGPHSLLVHICTDIIRIKLETGEIAGQTLNFLPGMSTIRTDDLPAEVTGDLDAPFAKLLHKMGQMVPQATTVVLNSFEQIEPTITNDLKSRVQKLHNIGFFNLASPQPSYSDENGCTSWLDKQKTASVAYVSFGTMLTLPPPELVALAEALEAKGVPFLWSFRDDSKKHLLEGFLRRTNSLGKVIPWAPQLQVLEHPSVGVFITHCGWNSVVESIGGGVPMICRPFFGDQKLNRRVVEDAWQIGVSVEGDVLTKTGVMDALDVVLSQENGKKMRENIGALKNKAVEAVGTGGSSTTNSKTLVDVVTGHTT